MEFGFEEKDFLSCCGSTRFANQMASASPFSSFDHAVSVARDVWFNHVDVNAWLQAFSAHPQIGQTRSPSHASQTSAQWSKGEQSTALATATDFTLQELSEWNARYREKFGFVFLICASGRTTDEILAELKRRYNNRPIVEFEIAAQEQIKITELRLAKLFSSRENISSKKAEGMTSKKLIPQRKRQRLELGQSSQELKERYTQQQAPPTPTIGTTLPSWDRFKFKTKAKYQRFLELQLRELLPERNVQLDEGEHIEFQDEINRRKWKFLANLPNQINEDIVKEFCVNTWPLDIKKMDKRSWVRSVEVCYNRKSINTLLGNPLTLQGELCQFQQTRKQTKFLDGIVPETLCIPNKLYETNAQGKPMRFKRQSLKTLAQIWTSFLLTNITHTTHTSDVRMPWAYPIYSIMKHIIVDIASVISEEIHQFVISNPSPSAAATKPLGFPALITALCAAQGVQIPNSSLSTIKLKNPSMLTLSRVTASTHWSNLV